MNNHDILIHMEHIMKSGIALLREILESCAGAERKVAESLLAEPRTAVFCTVAELARRAGTNPPAVVRLCKRAGLSGYRELQILLAKDIYTGTSPEEPTPAFELDSSQSVEAIAENIIERTKEALDRVISLLNPKAIEDAAADIAGARSVAIFGIGASSLVAYDLMQKLARLGIPVSFSFDPHVQITAACGLCDKDIALAISYSGKTPSIVKASEEARRNGTKVIAVTRHGPSPLARIAHIVLSIPATESVFRQAATRSRSTQLVVIDILYSVLVSRNIERAIPLIERSMRATHEPNQGEIE
jgi:DNA-binding MurR/RpiR family transcriptional regulator